MALDAGAIKKLGFDGFMEPLSTSCADHAGARSATLHVWDGKKWNVQKDRYEADQQIIKPMIKASAEKYAGEKKITKRDCAKESQ
jgi:branched-chain amino acid transport system substrate-binding protein